MKPHHFVGFFYGKGFQMALPEERIEESKIPCTDYALIKLVEQIQERLGVDDIDLAFELNEYSKKKRLNWAKWLTEKDITQFEGGKPLPSNKDFQVVNWVIRNMNEEDREVVFYGIGERNQTGGTPAISGYKQASPVQADSHKKLPLRLTGVKTGIPRKRRTGVARRA